ncbi:UDP-2,4-diacetamido-2,4,6-trideoxy-beta-L-altropyranose hydrolase [Pseudomonas sp. GLN_6]|uniref:UDP-2,4-diacetamido-2,4, 6-trideoxy-beta-L-altropyranose hydrolase n=1 Tax=Pseudomonas sp. GLN_6 TaxID=3367183 RepID=UPI00370CE3E4
MKFAFRVDSSLQIGSGHVMRCLTLANALRDNGHDCFFICREHVGNLNEIVIDQGFYLQELPLGNSHDEDLPHAQWLGASQLEDAVACIPSLVEWKPDWLIVDHYALDIRWELAVRRHFGMLMVLDDLSDRNHACDVLLDQNFGRTHKDYAGLVPAHCRIFTGSSYVLLRPQFCSVREESLARRAKNNVRKLLIQTGGMDQYNHAGEVLSALQRCDLPPNTHITVVLNSKAPAIKSIQQQALMMRWETRVEIDLKDMARLMAESDLAIGSGGGATYERIFLGLPSLLRPVASNQIEHLRKMADAGLYELYTDAEDLVSRVDRVVRDGVIFPPDVVRDGTSILACEVLPQSVVLLHPQVWDVRRTFWWLQDSGLRALFLMRNKPERCSHFKYWKNILSDPSQRVFSIFEKGVHVGNAGLKNISLDKSEAELWLYLGDGRGRGIGTRVISELERIGRDFFSLKRIFLHVSESNYPAIGLYRKSGYCVVCSDSEELLSFFGAKVVRMEKIL